MKILSVTNCPIDINLGSGKTVFMYTEGLRKLGHEVLVLEPKSYEYLYGTINKGKKIRQAFGSWQIIKKELDSQHFDLIEFYGDEFWLLTKKLSKLKKRPLLVAHTNGLELLAAKQNKSAENNQILLKKLRNKFFNYLSWMAFRNADAFISLCELDRKFVLEHNLYPESRTHIIPPGLDFEYLSLPFAEERRESIAFLGTWILRKGVDKFAHVTGRLLRKYPNLSLEIFGTQSKRSDLSKTDKTLLSSYPPEMHDRIIIYPRLSNKEIADHLSKIKIFFFPTQYEGFGMALAEAMACGCAAVTTATGFGAELKDKEEAIICDFEDLNSMETAICQLLQNDKLRLKIALRGREKANLLNWENNIKKLSIIYEQWIINDKILVTK